LRKRAAVILLGACVTACAHFPGTPKSPVLRLGVVIIDEGYVDYEHDFNSNYERSTPEVKAQFDKSLAQQRQWLKMSEGMPNPHYVWDPLCKKRFLTRYTRVPHDGVRGKKFAWMLVNSCQGLPQRCGGSKLEVVFNQWQYSPDVIPPGAQPNPPYAPGKPPFDGKCTLGKNVFSQMITPLTCKFDPNVARGSYRFQAVLRCGDLVLDNWDPEIVVDGAVVGEGEAGTH
jgi:hypothetical protein